MKNALDWVVEFHSIPPDERTLTCAFVRKIQADALRAAAERVIKGKHDFRTFDYIEEELLNLANQLDPKPKENQ